ncbi:unnamed protein product [Phyllotreta striolata]|uniref:DUF3668 domain-containing protein n=1 Tax=Phyllotreta striolata TaxID=444603 RepID=A0A9N9XRM4_PHYSR|nr:unnamed protein product [Phyllotreta striolata]
MNQLNGKYVNVVLSIECGRGMDFLKNSVYVTANFNGRILESDHLPPEECPPFNTELVWEIEKKELRKIRSSNIPLRVECITIDTQSRKERIGFALLNLRSAQIVPESKSNEPIASAWHKLIGCQADKKKSHPELYLSLSLRDHMFNEQPSAENPNNAMPFILEEDVQNMEDSLKGADTFALKYFENGHIQIGDEESANEPFVFNLLIKSVVNLDALLPEALVFQTNAGSYFLTFKILGIIVKTKPFQREMHTHLKLNEKIVVHLLSNRDTLEKFLGTQTVTVSFYHGYDKLGVTKLNYDEVWDRKEGKYYFKFPSPNGIVPFGCTEQSPYITLETWIKEAADEEEALISPKHPQTPRADEPSEKPKTKSIFSNICKKSKTPNEPDVEKMSIEEPDTQDSYRSPRNDIDLLPFVTKSVDTVVINDPLTPRPHAASDLYEKFVLIVSLKTLTWIAPPPDTKIMFKFLHPRAGSCTTIFTEISNAVQQEIVLNNLYVRIGYISTYDKIGKLLKNWYPKLVLANEHETYISDQKALNVNCSNTKCKNYDIEFKSLRTGATLTRIGVNVTMKVTDPKLEDDYENLYLLPIILDEIIVVKEVADLMAWKRNFKEQFERQLQLTKQDEIKRLDKEYQQKKDELEENVNKTIDKCKEVQNDLRNKLATLKIERELNKMGTNEYKYDDIYQNNCKLYSKNNTHEVIELLSKTQRDNECLKKLLAEQKEKFSEMEQTAIAKVETKSLLEEWDVLEAKFSQIQCVKNNFEEKWKKTTNTTAPNPSINANSNPMNDKVKSEENSNCKNDRLFLDIQGFYNDQSDDIETIGSTCDNVDDNF